MTNEPDPAKSFDDPVLGEIVGYDNVDDFTDAITAWNLSQGLDADGFPLKKEEGQ